ncbi:MAG: amidohydrolase family protein, partial [Gemmatimonadetes bacterium]|nr:amidohydrolase family protein [Gemmatimonadota bacterium]
MRPILTAALAIATCVQSSAASAQGTFIVRDVRLFDGERVTEHRSVVVRDGIITQVDDGALAVPATAQVVDGRGRTLLPGLIDAHVHLSDSAEADLRQSLAVGVTTDLDMWNGGARFERIKALRAADAPDVAGVRSAGTGATAPGGHPTQMGGGSFPTIDDPADAPAFVDARIAEGSDYIKIIYDDLSSLGRHQPMLDKRTLAALVDAAHARGKLVVVHILSEWQAKDAIEAGADGLAHLFTGATVSPDFARLAASHHVFVTPTLTTLYGGGCGEGNGPRIASDSLLRPYIRPAMRHQAAMTFPPAKGTSCEGTREALRQLVRAGVPVLTGTDSPAPGQSYGASVHGELEL